MAATETGQAAHREYRGRFAPSPSGLLHLGSLFTALASYLDARAAAGRWFVRIDDVDIHRTVPGAADRILASLEALGLEWDGPVVRQSQQGEAYRAALENLRARGLVYDCSCSRQDLAGQASAIYPGFCRNRLPARDRPLAVRLKVDGVTIAFEDLIQGPVRQNLATEVGDFVLYRRDNVYAYHLATVLDDASLGVTRIVRGGDLLDSTPRQIWLQNLLQQATPAYAHVPVLNDPANQKLSKRTLAPEAETRNPGGLLYRLLILLEQTPPPELDGAPAREVLAWAVAHWDMARLRNLRALTVDPSRFAA